MYDVAHAGSSNGKSELQKMSEMPKVRSIYSSIASHPRHAQALSSGETALHQVLAKFQIPPGSLRPTARPHAVQFILHDGHDGVGPS
jgi:hypothetical protein